MYGRPLNKQWCSCYFSFEESSTYLILHKSLPPALARLCPCSHYHREAITSNIVIQLYEHTTCRIYILGGYRGAGNSGQQALQTSVVTCWLNIFPFCLSFSCFVELHIVIWPYTAQECRRWLVCVHVSRYHREAVYTTQHKIRNTSIAQYNLSSC